MNSSERQLPPIPDSPPARPASRVEPFAHIVEQYVTDAAFLWLLRSQAVTSVLYTADDIAELDRRIQGLLDGLQASGDLAWKICCEQLELEEAGETFVAAVQAFQGGDTLRIQYVCERALGTEAMHPGLISALGWIEQGTAAFWIERFLGVTDPVYRTLGLAASGVRRHDPGMRLLQLLRDPQLAEQPRVHARALRLVGELKRRDLVPALNQGMDSDDTDIRFWSHWSAVLLGNRACIDALKPYVMQDTPCKQPALELAFNVLPVTEARQWISTISSDLDQHRTVISTTGILGDPHAVGWLIQQMHKPLYARLAGLSFNLITGIDLEQSGLNRIVESPPPDTEEDDFEDHADDVDGDLPWPDPLKVKTFWDQHGHGLQIGQRYFMGQPLASDRLKQVIVAGNQLQRHAAALKLALNEADEMFVNVAASAIR